MKFLTVIVFTLSCIWVQNAKAQTCLGETTVYTQSFGTGDQITSLQKGASSLRFKNNNITAGEYTINRKSNAGQFWQNAYDHTGDYKGKMLLVDASDGADILYIDTIQQIKPNTTYSLSFAVMNTSIPGAYAQQINTRVRIEAYYENGTGQYLPLAQFESESIQPTNNPSWNVAGGFIDVPPTASSIRYALRNIGGSGAGNTMALDDVTLIECASASTTMLLPATLRSFQALEKNSSIEIQWISLNELNLDHYVIEKSLNAKNWKPAATILAKGTSTLQSQYYWNDHETIETIQYYRLHMIDKDGRSLFSPIVRVKHSADAVQALQIENPMQHQLNMRYQSNTQTDARWILKNMQGLRLQDGSVQLQTGDNRITSVLTCSIPPGLYIVELSTKDGQKITGKIIKN